MAKNRKPRPRQQLGGKDANGVGREAKGTSTRTKDTTFQLVEVQTDIFGGETVVRVNGRPYKPQKVTHSLKRGEAGWQEVYDQAFRIWYHYRFEEPEIIQAIYEELCRQVTLRRVVNGSEVVTALKNEFGWHFSNDARTVLVLMAVYRYPEMLWFTVNRTYRGRFDSEGMPWAQYEAGWCHG